MRSRPSTIGARARSKTFTVAMAYTGDCCLGAHVLVTTVEQTDERGAEALVRRKLKRRGLRPGDAVVFLADGWQAHRSAAK
jgi:hypothetical protein